MKIESPLIQELLEEVRRDTAHTNIIAVLRSRFGAVPEELAAQIRMIGDLPILHLLLEEAATCADLDVFRNSFPLEADPAIIVAAHAIR